MVFFCLKCMNEKVLLFHTHLLLLLLLIYYQHHIFQWQKIVQGCQRIHFSFNSLYWGYSLLGIKYRNRTFHAHFTRLSYVPHVEQGSISQLPSHFEYKRYYLYQNKCKRLVFLFASHHFSIQNSHASSELLCLCGDKIGHP